MAEPQTYACGSAALLGRFRDPATCVCDICMSPAGSATRSCDDTPKWRGIAAARRAVEELLNEGSDEEPEAVASENTTKELFSSPAKTIFTHSVETGRTPSGAEGWRQTAARVENAHCGVPGWRASSPVNPATPSWQQEWKGCASEGRRRSDA